MRKDAENMPSEPNGHAAERLREFLRERVPPGTFPEEVNPGLKEKEKRKKEKPTDNKTKANMRRTPQAYGRQQCEVPRTSV
jgi:hypothetical protein